MIISYNWLHDYLPVAIPIDELSEILTSIGLEVEQIETAEKIKGGLEGLIIGEVLTQTAHPNADKLSMTTVDIGNGSPLQIVCGAPNVRQGQKVVVAPVNTTIHPNTGEPFVIKKAKIRGELSEGMICAEDEIGLGESHEGIMVLPEDSIPGTKAKDYFNIPLPDYAIHIGLTPNRSDAMSHIGVARDVCAYLSHHKNKSFEVQQPVTAIDFPQKETLPIYIHDTDACPRYCGISIQNIQVGASPDWLVQKLQTIGIRSINNIVDITNFILHEYGQPLHAFDADKIEGGAIHVRFVENGTVFKTLDDKEIKLTSEDLMICDTVKPMCIAGVYGGADSGVTHQTKNLFIESAYFNDTTIRKTSIRHGLRTDAATHYEKGVDIEHLLPALQRAAALITAIAGGQVASTMADVYPHKKTALQIATSLSYIQKLSGKDYAIETVSSILKSLGFTAAINGDIIHLTVPSHKTDISQPADIIEEILRIDGLNNIPIPDTIHYTMPSTAQNPHQVYEKVAGLLSGMGLQEIVTNSITHQDFYPGHKNLVNMLNSLTSELNTMRPSMLEGGLSVIQYNVNRKQSDLALYEFGRVYKNEAGRYEENKMLAIWLTGNQQPDTWNTKQKAYDIYYLKSWVQNIFEKTGIQKTQTQLQDQEIIITSKKQPIAKIYQVPPERLRLFDLKQDVYYAEIYWDTVLAMASQQKIIYKEIPKHPSVQRDLALVLDKSISYEQIEKATKQAQLPALQDFHLFDVFENEKLGVDKKSMALSYTFQLQDRTLTDTEIDADMQKLIKAYEQTLHAKIRS